MNLRPTLYGLPFGLVLFLSGWVAVIAVRAAEHRSVHEKCTTVIVGRNATSDGSVILAHNEDWGEFEAPLQWYPRKKHAPDATLSLAGGQVLKQVSETYGYLMSAAICNGINEFQVMITDNTGSCRPEMVRRETGIEMGDLIPLALQRARTAREAVLIMGSLIDQIGYRCVDGAEGDIFSVADPAEGWWMEVTTAGPWAAQRVPDDSFVVIANRFRIGELDPTDTSRFLASTNVLSFAHEKGWFTGTATTFRFNAAYSGVRTESQRREWRGNSVLGGAVLDPAESRLGVVPVRKLTPRDLMRFLRDHYEGVISAGTGKEAKVSPHQTAERSICRTYTDASTVAHLRGWFPRALGGVVWFAVGTPCASVYTPLYVGMESFPREYSTVTRKFDPDNAYWVFNALENLVDRNYHQREPTAGGGTKEDTELAIELVSRRWRQIEDEAFRMQPAIEKTAVDILSTDEALARSLLATFSQMMALRSFGEAQILLNDMRTRYER